MTLGNKIRQYRLAANLTIQGLADKIGITKGAVAAWEKDRAAPSNANMRLLSEILGIEVGDLFSSTNLKQPKTYTRPPRQNAAATTNKDTQGTRLRIPIRGFAQADYMNIGNTVKKPVGYIDLAPQFANIVDLYAVYITGDSMAPVFKHGDTRLVAPHTPFNIGDTVVFVIKEKKAQPETSYIKILSDIKTSESGRVDYYFDQHNPIGKPECFIVDRENIAQIHKIMTFEELLQL